MEQSTVGTSSNRAGNQAVPLGLSRHLALRTLATRALVLFVMVTVLVSALRIDSPLGVVLLVALLSWVDLRRRHESLFWGNLGYSGWQTTAVVVAVAFACELVFVIAVRPLLAAVAGGLR